MRRPHLLLITSLCLAALPLSASRAAELRFAEAAVIGRFNDPDENHVEIRPAPDGGLSISGFLTHWNFQGALRLTPGLGKVTGPITINGNPNYSAEVERTFKGLTVILRHPRDPGNVQGEPALLWGTALVDVPSSAAQQLNPLSGRWIGASGDYQAGVDRQVLWIEHQEVLDLYRSKPLRQFVFAPDAVGQNPLTTGAWKDMLDFNRYGAAGVKQVGDTLELTWTEGGTTKTEILTRKPPEPTQEEPVPEPETPTPEPETPREPEPTTPAPQTPAPRPTTPRPTTPQPQQPAPPVDGDFQPLGAWSVRVDKVENPRDDRLTHVYVTLRNDSTQRLLQTQGVSVLHETSQGVTVESDQSLKAVPGRPELFGVPVPLTLPGKTIRAKFVFDRNGTTTSITVMENGDQSATFEF